MRTVETLTAAFAASMIQFASAADMVNERDVGTQVVPPPGPVQNGALVDRCGGWALATPGMTCYALAQSLGVDLVTFTLLNPQLEKDCVHNFWGGYYYCAGKSVYSAVHPFRLSSLCSHS